MAGDDKESPPLTDQQQVDAQVGATDVTSRMSELMHDAFGFSRVRFFQFGEATNFEEHKLNDMIDLIADAKPADLENAGDALWKASDAINAAAAELKGHLKPAEDDWQGEAGRAFQKWGLKLVEHTEALATYADQAGVQITAAATGLASVRSAMPPRDTRLDPKTVDDIPVVARVDGNKDYAAAVKTEGHRQEAINQMNRLASFYSVSGKELHGLTPPTFEAMPNVGMPAAEHVDRSRSSSENGPQPTAALHRSEVDSAAREHSVVGHARTDIETVTPKTDDPASIAPDRPVVPVGTTIDSVDTLPQQTPTTPVTATTNPTTTPTIGPQGVPLPSYAQGVPNPLGKGPVGRALGATGVPRNSATAQGRAGTPGPASARGLGQGGTNPMGRPNATGQPGMKGGMPGSRPTSMGHGVTGGTPKQAGTSSGRQGLGPRGASRSNSGVVGGRPTSTGASAKSGPKMPRGTVIGGEGAAGSRTSSGGISQRGVMGAPSTTNGTARNQTPGRGAIGSSDGVTGAPAGRNSASRAGRSGFTAGGSGLVRGSEGNQSSDQEEGDGVQRPDYLVEDEQTHLPKKPQRDVPPVIDQA
ncbi:hypothetical protein [Streptomyces sp. NPDC056105]|uniref:hypothetical protein n=1 Tax=Streptomyces sp. NPDC056105 TaxID=3345714 RepID=UPI0035DF98C5